MKRARRPFSSETRTFTAKQLLLASLASFFLGGGAAWLMIDERPPSRKTNAPASIAETGAEAAPDISALAPADAATTLADWNYDHQNWSHALEHYQQALALGRDNPDVRTDLGNCYRFLGQPQKALEQYQLAQKQDRQHENSLLNQAGLFAEVLHDKARAKAVADEFIARFPNSPRTATAKKLAGAPEGNSGGGKEGILSWLNEASEQRKLPDASPR